MHISKATVSSPLLKYPMTNVAASVTLADDVVQVGHAALQATVEKRGRDSACWM